MQTNHVMDEKGFYDIYSVWHVPFWQKSWFFWMVIFCIALLLAVVGFVLYKKYFVKKAAPLTPWQRALHDLEKLHTQTVASQNDGKQFYLALTAILKQYMQDRFNFPLVGKTDQEMVHYLKESELEKRYNVSDICNGCVLIKFANQTAMQEQTKEHLARSIRLVRETTHAQNQ